MFTKKITLVLSVFVALFIFNGTLFAQEKAFPKKGEGITLFLKRHNRVGKEYHDEFVKLNKTKLGNGNSLKMGVKYQLPPLKGARLPWQGNLITSPYSARKWPNTKSRPPS